MMLRREDSSSSLGKSLEILQKEECSHSLDLENMELKPGKNVFSFRFKVTMKRFVCVSSFRPLPRVGEHPQTLKGWVSIPHTEKEVEHPYSQRVEKHH